MRETDQLIRELRAEGIQNPDVLTAIRQIPRHKFVLPANIAHAYDNTPLPIDCDQTISQPYIVALMTQALLENGAKHKILEIGTGSGYQTAILASLFDEVWTIERIEPLQLGAKRVLQELGFKNIHFRVGDGTHGWPTEAPFDGIIVTAAPVAIPPELISQMDPKSSTLVIPVGETRRSQKLMLVRQKNNVVEKSVLSHVSFVPLISDENDT